MLSSQTPTSVGYPLKQCIYKIQWLANEVVALLIVLIEIQVLRRMKLNLCNLKALSVVVDFSGSEE